MPADPSIEQAILAKAGEHGDFAIAYALLRVAEKLEEIAGSIEGAGDQVAAGLANVLVASTPQPAGAKTP